MAKKWPASSARKEREGQGREREEARGGAAGAAAGAGDLRHGRDPGVGDVGVRLAEVEAAVVVEILGAVRLAVAVGVGDERLRPRGRVDVAGGGEAHLDAVRDAVVVAV